MSELDDEFMKQALEAEQAERARQANRGSSFAYENIKFVGLESKKQKLFRFVGTKWDFKLGDIKKPTGPTDARVVRVAKLLDDKNKTMRLILPLFDRDETNHPLIRLIQKVNEGEWRDTTEIDPATGKIKLNPKTGKPEKVKHYEHAVKNPDIFAMVNRSRLLESDNKVKFGLEGSGWAGKEFFAANVIARELMPWHRANKHTAILAKNIGLGKPDASGVSREYPDPGVPYFGFTLLLNDMIKYYGNWENFDYVIERTGLTQPAYKVDNANKNPERLMDPKLREILGAAGPLSEEEASWERYDLDKIYGISSYTKIINRLQRSIQQVDAALGTNFFNEIKFLADQEEATRKANKEAEKEAALQEQQEQALENQEESIVAESAPASPIEEEEPVIIRSAPAAAPKVEAIDARDRELLPGWPKLTTEEKGKVLSAFKEGDTWNVTYSVKARGKCGVCGHKSPETFAHCPVCAGSFGTY